VTLEPLEEIPPRVMLHHGTAETPARVARAGDGFAQLRLSRPVVAARGDRVVLRAGTTVGGGVVLDPNPPRPCSCPGRRRMAVVAGVARRASRRPRP
jgi:selenocysteine-specific translation elongation factor